MRRKVPTATKWAKLTTQLPWCTLVTADWNRLSTEERAITLIHESVHHAQQERWGAWRFTWMYANAKWRLAIELHAYRSNVRTMKAWGMGELSMRVMVRRIARSLVSTYRLGRLRGVESLAIKILSEEIDR